MGKNVEFTYFLDGEEVKQEQIDWDSDITVRVIDDVVYIIKNITNE
jgi:hypothetical protein